MPSTTCSPARALALLGVILTGAAGCRAESTAPTDLSLPRSANAAQAGLATTLHVTPEALSVGAPFTVRYTLTNTQADTARLVFGCSAPLRSLGLRAAQPSTSTYLRSQGCRSALSSAALAPGGDLVVEVRWRTTSDTSEPAAPALRPGRYLIEADPALVELNGQRVTLAGLHVEFTVR